MGLVTVQTFVSQSIYNLIDEFLYKNGSIQQYNIINPINVKLNVCLVQCTLPCHTWLCIQLYML